MIINPRTLIVTVAVAWFAVTPARGEDIEELFTNVKKYVAMQAYPKALEELRWMERELQKLHAEKVESFFPDELAGLTGGQPERQSVLGFTSMKRTYNGDGKQVEVSLTGGTASGGGLAAIMQIATALGAQQGAQTFRLDGRTATLANESGGGTTLVVSLKSGSTLHFETPDADAGERLKSAAGLFPVAPLDEYLTGR